MQPGKNVDTDGMAAFSSVLDERLAWHGIVVVISRILAVLSTAVAVLGRLVKSIARVELAVRQTLASHGQAKDLLRQRFGQSVYDHAVEPFLVVETGSLDIKVSTVADVESRKGDSLPASCSRRDVSI
jgi:hypothetical protein